MTQRIYKEILKGGNTPELRNWLLRRLAEGSTAYHEARTAERLGRRLRPAADEALDDLSSMGYVVQGEVTIEGHRAALSDTERGILRALSEGRSPFDAIPTGETSAAPLDYLSGARLITGAHPEHRAPITITSLGRAVLS